MGRVRKGVTTEATPEDARFSAPQLRTALPGDARAPPADYQSEAAPPLRAGATLPTRVHVVCTVYMYFASLAHVHLEGSHALWLRISWARSEAMCRPKREVGAA